MSAVKSRLIRLLVFLLICSRISTSLAQQVSSTAFTAAAYDFETNLKPGDPRGPGSTFMTSIVKARCISLIQNGIPVTAKGGNEDDPGLADPLARMFSNFQLLKGKLGFNNPETETGRFSMRSELFRIQGGATGNKTWRDQLTQLMVSNILEVAEFKRYCIPFSPQLPAYNDSGTFNPSETTSSSRLIGRSVWNTQWLLIIPAGTLLSDRNEALQQFINGSLMPNGQRDGNGVSDIKIFFQTYSYAGN